MSTLTHHNLFRRGLTLVEMMASIVVIGIVCALVMPVILGASDSYAAAINARNGMEAVAFAMDRSVRLLREAPVGASANTLGVSIAQPAQLRFTDGRGLELDVSGNLLLRDAAGITYPLLDQVTTFQIDYLGTDGVTSTSGTPTSTQRFRVKIVSRGIELRAAAFARVGGLLSS